MEKDTMFTDGKTQCHKVVNFASRLIAMFIWSESQQFFVRLEKLIPEIEGKSKKPRKFLKQFIVELLTLPDRLVIKL